jgi:hypothetical protein
MQNMIEPLAQAVVEKESDKLTRDVKLKVKMKTLMLTGIKELLQLHAVMDKYRKHAPFTWKLLHIFSAMPNKFQKQRKKKSWTTAVTVRMMIGLMTLILQIMNK